MMTMMMPMSSSSCKDAYSPMKDEKRGWKPQDSAHTMDTEATEEESSSLGGGEVLTGDYSEHCYQQQQPDHEQASSSSEEEEEEFEEATPTKTTTSSSSSSRSASGRKPARRQVSSASAHSVPSDANNKSVPFDVNKPSADWHDSFALDDDIDVSSSNPLVALKGSISELLNSVAIRKNHGSDQEEEEDDEDDDDDDDVPAWEKPYDPTEELEELQFTKADVKSVVMDTEAFRTLQRSLRQRQCCTNLYLSQTMHCYVKHVKEVRQRNEARLSRSTSTPSFLS